MKQYAVMTHSRLHASASVNKHLHAAVSVMSSGSRLTVLTSTGPCRTHDLTARTVVTKMRGSARSGGGRKTRMCKSDAAAYEIRSLVTWRQPALRPQGNPTWPVTKRDDRNLQTASDRHDTTRQSKTIALCKRTQNRLTAPSEHFYFLSSACI
jgi:hypothetical protein